MYYLFLQWLLLNIIFWGLRCVHIMDLQIIFTAIKCPAWEDTLVYLSVPLLMDI